MPALVGPRGRGALVGSQYPLYRMHFNHSQALLPIPLGLHRKHLRISSPRLQQRRMCALLDDADFGEEENAIGETRRTQSVRDEQHRFASRHVAEMTIHIDLARGVECGSRLVEDEHQRRSHIRTGDGQLLPLPQPKPMFSRALKAYPM